MSNLEIIYDFPFDSFDVRGNTFIETLTEMVHSVSSVPYVAARMIGAMPAWVGILTSIFFCAFALGLVLKAMAMFWGK